MSKSASNQQAAIEQFWDRFLNVVHAQGIKSPMDRWYVIRAEEYIKAFPKRRLGLHTKDDLEAYLQTLGRKSTLKSWQFRQAVDAIQILFRHIVKVPWIDAVDWEYWLSSSRDLPDDHATVARDYQPVPGKHDISPDIDSGAAVRETHREGLDNLRIEVRRRGYSIRTEKTYVDWVCRYLAFHGNRDPGALGAPGMAAFLEHLAVGRKVAASTQNQALNALVFFYGQVLKQPIGSLESFEHTGVRSPIAHASLL